MTNKEMKELIQKQNKQISELISLVRELEKKDKPISVCTPWKISYPCSPSNSTAPDFKDWPPQTWMKNEPMSKRVSSTIYSNEPLCVMDSCLGNEVTASELDMKETQAAKDLSTVYSNAAIF